MVNDKASKVPISRMGIPVVNSRDAEDHKCIMSRSIAMPLSHMLRETHGTIEDLSALLASCCKASAWQYR